MPRPILATLDTSALADNLAVVRQRAPRAKAWAVVKANAYGHGLARVFPELQAADGFALLDLEEALLLRELGWAGPILLLEGFFKSSDLTMIDRYGLSTAVHCEEQLRMLEMHHATRPINVFLKMNTGMNRLGFRPAQFRRAWERARSASAVGQITLMTHFSDADGPRGVGEQCAAFERGAEGLAGARSMANSAAVLWHPDTHHDWVRPGIVLYGGSPSGVAADIAGIGLRPVMSLGAELIGVQTLAAGETVGYGSTFTACEPMRLGVVSCGYADGYPRHAPTGTPVWVDGVRTRLLGRVSMDMLTVDLQPCPQARVGSPVELWGARLPIDDVAQACGTVGYELMCALAPRVPVRTL